MFAQDVSLPKPSLTMPAVIEKIWTAEMAANQIKGQANIAYWGGPQFYAQALMLNSSKLSAMPYNEPAVNQQFQEQWGSMFATGELTAVSSTTTSSITPISSLTAGFPTWTIILLAGVALFMLSKKGRK